MQHDGFINKFNLGRHQQFIFSGIHKINKQQYVALFYTTAFDSRKESVHKVQSVRVLFVKYIWFEYGIIFLETTMINCSTTKFIFNNMGSRFTQHLQAQQIAVPMCVSSTYRFQVSVINKRCNVIGRFVMKFKRVIFSKLLCFILRIQLI